MKTVWIVSEGTPGHVIQSTGLVEAMKARINLNVVQVFGRTTARGWLRPSLRLFMSKDGRALPDWLLRKVAEVEYPKGGAIPDLIISSGGGSIVPARTWACEFDVPYFFIGAPTPYPASWF